MLTGARSLCIAGVNDVLFSLDVCFTVRIFLLQVPGHVDFCDPTAI